MRLLLLIAAFGLQVCLYGQGLSYALPAHELGVESTSIESTPTHLLRREGLLLAEATVDGNTGYFIIDTGSPGLLLNGAVAKRQREGELAGTGGETPFARVLVERLQLGGLVQTGVVGLQIDMSYTEAVLGLKLLGIIGYQQLSSGVANFSLSQNKLWFGERAEDSAESTYYPFSLLGHLPILQASVGETTLNFAFDSGSSVNLIDLAHLPAMETSLRGRPATRTLAGVDNQPQDVKCALVRLTFVAQDFFRDRPFLFVDLAHLRDEAPTLAGLLSPNFWDAVDFSIDYSNQRLDIH